MAEVVDVDDQTISSGGSGSVQSSPDFRDPLGVNDHQCAAVDDESDEFDFDVSALFTDRCLASLRSTCIDNFLFGCLRILGSN